MARTVRGRKGAGKKSASKKAAPKAKAKVAAEKKAAPAPVRRPVKTARSRRRKAAIKKAAPPAKKTVAPVPPPPSDGPPARRARVAVAPRRKVAVPRLKAAAPTQRFTVTHLNEADFVRTACGPYALYRDLGIAAASGGLCQAHVIRLPVSGDGRSSSAASSMNPSCN